MYQVKKVQKMFSLYINSAMVQENFITTRILTQRQDGEMMVQYAMFIKVKFMTNLFLYINLPTVEITTIIIPMFIQWGGLTKALFAMYFTNFFLSRVNPSISTRAYSTNFKKNIR